MKANAPEKIYFDGESNACKLPIFSSQNIEYTLTDAFIEKACEWLFHQANYYTKLKIDAHDGGVYADFYADKMVDDFKKAMKLWHT